MIRKPRNADSPPFESLEEERTYEIAHRGAAYTKDNQKVYEILTQLLSGTMAWTWISSYESSKNGRGAVQALRTHYDGPGQVEKRLAYAQGILNNIHYKSERQYSFENYVTKLSEAFEILKDNQIPKQEREKVDYLLNNIRNDSHVILAAKTNVKMNPNTRTNFQLAVDHMSELIGATFAHASNEGKIPARNVSRVETGRGGRGGRGRGGRGGRGNKGGRGDKYNNGVDISDMTRDFTKQEWFKLSIDVRQQIKEARIAAKNKRKIAAVSKEPENNPGTKESPDQQDDDEAVVSNGTSFGSGAYGSTKRVRYQGNK